MTFSSNSVSTRSLTFVQSGRMRGDRSFFTVVLFEFYTSHSSTIAYITFRWTRGHHSCSSPFAWKMHINVNNFQKITYFDDIIDNNMLNVRNQNLVNFVVQFLGWPQFCWSKLTNFVGPGMLRDVKRCQEKSSHTKPQTY